MGNLKNNLLNLMQAINDNGLSVPMNYIKLDFVEKMEYESKENIVFGNSVKKMEMLTNKALKNINDYNTISEIKNIYSEAYIFSKLKSHLIIEKIQEGRNETPDFKVIFRGNEIFIELKSLNMADGTVKQRDIMEKSKKCRIDSIVEAKRNNQPFAIAYYEIEPYKKDDKECDRYSVKIPIECLIDKINQNIKKKQYQSGDTVLCIDLSEQLTIMDKPSQSIQKYYFDKKTQKKISGILWHVAFGKIGTQLFKPDVDFLGSDSNMNIEKLEKEGILISHPYIGGLIFHIEDFFSLFISSEENFHVTDCLRYFSKGYCNNNIDSDIL